MDPRALRSSIPVVDRTAYLNSGAAGPSPRRVVEAAEAFRTFHEYEAPAGEGVYEPAFDLFDDVRETVATHVGARPRDVALTQSTSDGLGRIVAAMDWSPGDVVVRTDREHPSGVLPFERLRDRVGVEVRVVGTEDGRIDRDAFAAALEGARLATFNSVCWRTGVARPVPDLVDLAHEAGARVLVDAVQSLGQRPVDVAEWGADAVAAAGHKWLLGPWGSGILYVDRSFARSLDPAQVGYRGVDDHHDPPCELKPDARRFEVATVAPAPYAGLAEAVRTIEAVGYDAITARIERLTDRLKDGLDPEALRSPRAFESGLVAFEGPGDGRETVERLREDAGVRVLALPDGTLRASVHAFNTAADVDALLGAL